MLYFLNYAFYAFNAFYFDGFRTVRPSESRFTRTTVLYNVNLNIMLFMLSVVLNYRQVD